MEQIDYTLNDGEVANGAKLNGLITKINQLVVGYNTLVLGVADKADLDDAGYVALSESRPVTYNKFLNNLGTEAAPQLGLLLGALLADSDFIAGIQTIAAGDTPVDPGDGGGSDTLQDVTEFTSTADRKSVQISPTDNDASYPVDAVEGDGYGYFKPEIKATGDFTLYHLADKTQQGGFFGVSPTRDETGKSQILSGIRFDQKNGGAQCKFATIASNAFFDTDPTMDVNSGITPAMKTERISGVIKSYWSLDNGVTWTRNTNAPDVAFTGTVYPFGFFDTAPSCVNGMQQLGFVAV